MEEENNNNNNSNEIFVTVDLLEKIKRAINDGEDELCCCLSGGAYSPSLRFAYDTIQEILKGEFCNYDKEIIEKNNLELEGLYRVVRIFKHRFGQWSVVLWKGFDKEDYTPDCFFDNVLISEAFDKEKDFETILKYEKYNPQKGVWE